MKRIVCCIIALLLIGSCGFYNDPPVCEAGEDFEVTMGERIHLDGTHSQDSDGDSCSFEWTLFRAPDDSDLDTASIENSDTVTASLLPDTSGTYVFRLTIGDGMFSDSDYVSVTVLGDVSTPPVPKNLEIDNPTRTSLTISWDAADSADTYLVYRANSSDGEFSESVYEGTNTIYIDEGLNPNTRYYYKFAARNSAGRSDQSDAVMGRTLP